MLSLNQVIVKEHVGMFKLSDAYDILDPQTGAKVGLAKEVVPGWVQVLRLIIDKGTLPTSIVFINAPNEAGDGERVMSIERGFTFLRSKIRVVVGQGREIGYFKAKLFTLGGGFNIFDLNDRKVGEVKGDWKGWSFTILDEHGQQIGTVAKQWAGLGKELFTSADTYVISVTGEAAKNEAVRSLILAAGLAIDTVFKEKG
jgi:uncharacterized protein YxjI